MAEDKNKIVKITWTADLTVDAANEQLNTNALLDNATANDSGLP